MIGDLIPAPPVPAKDDDPLNWWPSPGAEPDINPTPPPPGMTQAEWDAYALEAVLAWRKIPFREAPAEPPKPRRMRIVEPPKEEER
jgi:hypothetical protein